MPLTTPPQLYLNGGFRTPEWDVAVLPSRVVNGERSMGPADVVFWRWTVQLDNEPAQVFRLRLAGPDAADPNGALVLPIGRHQVTAVISHGLETRTVPAGAVVVRA